MRILASSFVLPAILLGTAGAPAEDAAAARRPNIVFILADDWGWGDLGCHGHPQLRTPHLDRLAAQGTRFTQFYSASGVCSPSRTAFMTGQFPARHRIHGHLAEPESNAKRGMAQFLDPAVPTLTRVLHDAGYAVAHFGKWHLGHSPDAPEPSAYGVDAYRTVAGNGPAWPGGPDFRARLSERIVDESIAFIETNRDRPFLVQAWLLDTHARLEPSEDQLAAYPKATGALRIYYSAATAADAQIGRLLRRLDELGLAENTIVVFSSDNGPEEQMISNASEHAAGSPGPFRGRKRSLYEGGVRVPFIVRWPGRVPAGRVDDETPLGAVDFLPTLGALAGVKLPAGHAPDGEDLSEALRGRPRARTRPLFWEWRFRIFGHVLNHSPRLAIRDGRWKLLMNPDRSRVELYDIPSDPSELANLADRQPDVVKRLSQAVLAWHATLPEGPVEPEAGRNEYPWPKGAEPATR